MAQELLLVFSLMAIHSVYSLGETDTYVSPTHSVLSCEKCPPGFSTFCTPNEKSHCVPCVEGTYSEKHSRRSKCRPCSSCQDDEFELQPCTRTSNVVCKACSKCGPGFVVLTPCNGTRDTVCENCTVAKGQTSYGNIECDESEIEDHLKGKEKDKPFMTIIEVEKPWPDGEKKSKHQHKLAVDENYPKATVSSPGFPSVKPTPSSSISTKANNPSKVSSKSITGMRTSVEPSLTPTMPAEVESPPKVQHTKPTTKLAFDTNTEEPSSYEMQGDDGNVPPRHTTRRSIDQNKPKLQGVSSVSPSEQENMFNMNARGMGEEHSTGFSPHYTLSGTGVERGGEIPVPGNRNTSRSKSSRGWLWGVVVVATGFGTALAVMGVSISKWRQCRKSQGCFFKCPQPKCRRPRCPASSDCCDGDSVSSVSGVCAEQNNRNPVNHGVPTIQLTTENESDNSLPNSNNPTQHTFLPSEQTVVVADVHHNTVFDLFPGIRSYPEYITQAEARFNSSGGTLRAPDSNVSIIVDSGAVEGDSQRFFFRVIYDERLLLQSIQKTPEMTLIAPVIECGPDDINLLKPVEVVIPHCLYLDEVKKDSVFVYRCGHYSDRGANSWEKVPSASEKTCQSNAWFTVKKNSVHIKTKTFSFWSIFACGGPKRKRATVLCSRPDPKSDLIYLRFYIYSDNEDSKKRVEERDEKRFPESTPAAKEKPFKMYNDSKDVKVKLTDLEKGWELDKTDSEQTYSYETAYRNGFRTKDSCDFAVKPTHPGVKGFSCNMRFQQEEHTTEYKIYVNPGFSPQETIRRFSVESSRSETPSNITSATGAGSALVVLEENAGIQGQENKPSPDSQAKVSEPSKDCFVSLGSDDEPVIQSHCNCISPLIGERWKNVLRNLKIEERPTIANVDKDYDTVEEKSYQGLLVWMRSRGTQGATTKKLCIALRLAGCSEALEALLKEGVSCDACAPTPESSADLGTCV